MIFLDLALKNLKRHWIRSLLATTGIIIGVLAIAALGIMGNSINLLVANVISDVGDTVIITPHVAAGTGDFFGDPRRTVQSTISKAELDRISRVSGQNRVIPVQQSADEISFGDDSGYATVIGLAADDSYYLLDVREGQYLRQNSPGCLVGHYLAKEWKLSPGSRIMIGNESVRVSGILEERGFAIDINPDYALVVDAGWFASHFSRSDEYDQVIIKIENINDIDTVKQAIDHQMNRRETVVDITDSRDLLSQYQQIYDQITVFLIGIGAISLVVAAVSILNVMIISVTERIREIGILRSFGATRKQVLVMFLYESMILGVIGSAVGGVLSVLGGILISGVAIEVLTTGTSFGENATIFDFNAVLYVAFAILFGIVVSTLSGFYPAWKASKMTPIEALRHE
jgi:putative ABC transport system permease protein